MRNLAEALRLAARQALPKGAFLRRDRGSALFVSDAPRLCPPEDWPAALAARGFEWELRGGLLYLRPGPVWLTWLEARYPEPPDAFCAGFARFAGLGIEAESLALFALGAQLLDGAPDDGGFERGLRRRAAECMRLDRTAGEPRRGGGLYACALAGHLLRAESEGSAPAGAPTD